MSYLLYAISSLILGIAICYLSGRLHGGLIPYFSTLFGGGLILWGLILAGCVGGLCEPLI